MKKELVEYIQEYHDLKIHRTWRMGEHKVKGNITGKERREVFFRQNFQVVELRYYFKIFSMS